MVAPQLGFAIRRNTIGLVAGVRHFSTEEKEVLLATCLSRFFSTKYMLLIFIVV